MNRVLEGVLFFIVCTAVSAVFFYSFAPHDVRSELFAVGNLIHEKEQSTRIQNPSEQVLFVGDIMLARAVERTMDAYGNEYPYQYMREVFDEHTFLFANFEAAIPEVHEPTPDLITRFSVDEHFIPTLQDVGFTHLSLANNHSADYQEAGLEHTKVVLSQNEITPFGIPKSVGTSSVVFLEADGATIAIVALEYIDGTPDAQAVAYLLDEARENATLVVVYVHWGTEYELVHSPVQQSLAELFAVHGVDLVIGHHPHVVQDIETVGDTLVFYSLGNFIFDQYFSDEVATGLTLSLDSKNRTISLIPVSTKSSRVAPQPMPGVERDLFLRDLAKRSDGKLREAIKSGNLAF